MRASNDIPFDKTRVTQAASGSPFDMTKRRTTARPGAHKIDKEPIDELAFTNKRPSSKKSPKSFMKSGDGHKLPPVASPSRRSVSRGSPRKRQSTKKRPNPPNSEFRFFYERGDLPVSVYHFGVDKIQWKHPIAELDFHHYLPIFFSGLREVEHPYSTLAYVGSLELLMHGGDKILSVIPQLIIPITQALNTRDKVVIRRVLLVLQQLVVADKNLDTGAGLIGQALVPYYRQILPILNIFKHDNKNCGDAIEYNQRRAQNIGDLITRTLQLLEENGGDDAFINIKYLVPTYESCLA